jgi:CHAD domain-containing protein
VVAFLKRDAVVVAEDAESVHQARRAARRLRAALRLYRPFFDRLWAGSLADEVRWLARRLGVVRDLDVVGERFVREGGSLALGPIHEAMEANRRLARQALAEALESRRRRVLREKLREASRHPWLRGELSEPAGKRLRRRLRSLWQRLKAARDGVRLAPGDEAYHEVRKRGKDLRLAIEIAAGDMGRRKALDRLDRALGRLVARLGERQDAVVAARLIRELDASLEVGREERRLAVEALVARWAEEVDRVDAEFGRLWRRVRRSARRLFDR